MSLSMIYNLGSIIIGLVAWLFGYWAIRRTIIRKDIKASYTCSLISFAMCIISLLFQLLEVGNRVDMEDLSAIYDTINAVIFAAKVLITVNLGLNIVAWVRARRIDVRKSDLSK